MKKIIALALVLVFALALAIPTFAVDGTIAEDKTITGGTPQSTNVTYNVSGSYTLSVPATLTANAAETENVEISNVLLYKDTTLKVTVEYSTMQIQDLDASAVAFVLKDGSDATINSGTVLFTYTAGGQTKAASAASKAIKATVDESAMKYAGVYSGAVTFTVTVDAQA